jgi:hypothetical protein
VWSHFLEHGTHALGATISANLELAALLARRVDGHPRLRRLAPTALNIVVFRYEPTGDTPRTTSLQTQAAAYDAISRPAAPTKAETVLASTLRQGWAGISSGRSGSSMGARSTPVPSPCSLSPDTAAAVGAVSHTLRENASAPVKAAVRPGSPSLAPRKGAEPGRGRVRVGWAASKHIEGACADHSSPTTPSRNLIGDVQLNGSRFVSPSAVRACGQAAGTAGLSPAAEAELEAALDSLNDAIVVELQERGIAAPSTARVRGRLAIRVNLTNHRTREEDLDILLRAVCDIGAELAPTWPGIVQVAR